MALKMTAHYLRNNPIHPGLNFRVLLMLSFVSGRFDHALFACVVRAHALGKVWGNPAVRGKY